MPLKKMGVRGIPNGSRCMGLARMTMGRRSAWASANTCTESRKALGRAASSTISAHSRVSCASDTSTVFGRANALPLPLAVSVSSFFGSHTLSRSICCTHRRRIGSANFGSWKSRLMAARRVERPPVPTSCVSWSPHIASKVAWSKQLPSDCVHKT